MSPIERANYSNTTTCLHSCVCVHTWRWSLVMQCPWGRRTPLPCVSWTDSFTASLNRHSLVRARICSKYQHRLKTPPESQQEKLLHLYTKDNTNADLQYSALNSASNISAYSPYKMDVKGKHGQYLKYKDDSTLSQFSFSWALHDRQCWCAYRDVVACAEKPITDEVKAGYSGAKVNSVGFREKVDPRKQLIANDVIGILEVGLGLSQGATQYTLAQWVTNTSMSECVCTNIQ